MLDKNRRDNRGGGKVKRILICLTALVFALGMVGMAEAALVSFLYNDLFEGVDGDTSGWSTSGNTEVNLGESWSLLNGNATVYAYSLIWSPTGEDPELGILTHRWNRGLGVLGGENDEIDYVNSKEGIKIVFNNDYYLNSFEIRSLFDEADGIEEARVNLMNGGVTIDSVDLVGVETSGDGVVSYSLGTPILVDEIRFTIAQNSNAKDFSEFAVAKLDVNPVPEPATMLLLGSGLLGLAALSRRKRS